MLLLALGAVVVGFAFLVVSLLSQDAGWAWGCIAACVVGAAFVVADAVRRRSATRAVEDPGAGDAQDGPRPVEAVADPGTVDADPAEDEVVPAEEQPEPVGSVPPGVPTQSVLVVDENPEFHVVGCGALDGRATIALPLDEAVDLGFTPCARCTPVARLTGSSLAPVTG